MDIPTTVTFVGVGGFIVRLRVGDGVGWFREVTPESLVGWGRMVSVSDVRGDTLNSCPGRSDRDRGHGVTYPNDRPPDLRRVGSGGGNRGLVNRVPGLQTGWVER